MMGRWGQTTRLKANSSPTIEVWHVTIGDHYVELFMLHFLSCFSAVPCRLDIVTGLYKQGS